MVHSISLLGVVLDCLGVVLSHSQVVLNCSGVVLSLLGGYVKLPTGRQASEAVFMEESPCLQGDAPCPSISHSCF